MGTNTNTSNTPRRRRGRRPSALQRTVTERFGAGVKVHGERPSGGRRVSIDGVPSALTNAMWLDDSGNIVFDTTPPALRRKELSAARRLESAGKTIVAEKIRARVAPEVITDRVALSVLLATATPLAVAKELVAKSDQKPVWNRHFDKGADYGVLTVKVGGSRIHAGSDADGQPWWAVDNGRTASDPTTRLADVLAAV
jgi:hypothetical protein